MTNEETVAGIVRDVLGEQPTAVEHVPTIEDTTVYRIEAPSGRLFFKTEHEGHDITLTAWAYERAAEAGVPSPPVVHLDASRKRWPEDFVILRAVPGTDLEHDPLEGDELRRVLADSGRLMRRLHTITLDGFGELERDGDDVIGEKKDHRSYLRSRLAWGLPYLVARGLLTAETHDDVVRLIDHADVLAPPPPRGSLLHGDVGLDHIFVDRTTMTITGLIDFEAECADPIVDLGSFHYFYPDLIDHVLGGYGDLPSDIDVRLELYGLVQAIGSTRWDHEKGFPQYIEHGCSEIVRRTKKLRELL